MTESAAKPLRIAIVAGEPSGDLLAAHLIAALKARLPNVIFYGIAGPKMLAQGCTTLFPQEKLAVRGYVEVLRHYREIMGIRKQLKAGLLADPPDCFIGVDAPDFNLDLELGLREAGIKTVHFIGPSIWAWRPERIEKIRRAVDKVLLIFPFEAKIYADAGVPHAFVGHPLADVIPEEIDQAAARERLQLVADAAPKGKLVAVLPGSRVSELELLGTLLVRTAQRMHADAQARGEALTFIVPLATPRLRGLFEASLKEAGTAENGAALDWRLMDGRSHDVLAACDFCVCCSGTATLEVALFKKPMVIVYRWARITWWMMRRKLMIPYIGLPNIMAGEFIVPEFIADNCTPEKITPAAMTLMRDPDTLARLHARYVEMHRALKQNTAERAADAVIPLLSMRA